MMNYNDMMAILWWFYYLYLPNLDWVMQNWISVSVKIKILVQSDQCRKLSVDTILNQYLANLFDNAKFQNILISVS